MGKHVHRHMFSHMSKSFRICTLLAPVLVFSGSATNAASPESIINGFPGTIAFINAKVTDDPNASSNPKVMQVKLSTHTDLEKYSEKFNVVIVSRGNLCREGGSAPADNENRAGQIPLTFGNDPHFRGLLIMESAETVPHHNERTAGSDKNLYIYNVEFQLRRAPVDGVQGYDLTTDPEDVCLTLGAEKRGQVSQDGQNVSIGPGVAPAVETDYMRLPKAIIAAAVSAEP